MGIQATPETIEELRQLVECGVERRRMDRDVRFVVAPGEVPMIHELMKQYPGVGYVVNGPSPSEHRRKVDA